MRLDKDEKPERLNYNLWVVRVILERISNVCVGEFGVSPLSAIRTYEVSCVDHSFLRQTSTLLRMMSPFVRKERNLNKR